MLRDLKMHMYKKWKLIIILLIAFLLRLLLVPTAYHGDLNNNISWGTLAAERGLSGFYGSADADDWPYSAPNQPPLTILMFAGLRLIWVWVDKFLWWVNYDIRLFPSRLVWFWRDFGMTFLVKLPSIVADLGIFYLILKYLMSKKKKRLGLILGMVWLINPIGWYTSSIWGQTDSIVNLFGLASILFLLRKDLVKFCVVFTLSFLFKGSLAIFVPVLGFIAIKQKHKVSEWIKALIFSIVTIILVSIWFHPYIDFPIWFIKLYQERILPGEIGYLTANAFNIWWLVDPGKVMDNEKFFGITARLWGIITTLAGMTGIIYWLNKKGLSDRNIFFSLSVVAILSFLFMTRIHERYLYPFFPLSTLSLAFFPQLTIFYIVLSVTFLLNLYHLFWAPPIPFLEKLFINSQVGNTLAIINIIVFIFVVFLFQRKLSSNEK
jgi:Gpi18-like mannosyltransferase